jgi:hypothetical protein
MTNEHRIEFKILDQNDEPVYSVTIGVDSGLMRPDIRADAIDSAFRLMQRRIALDFAE